MSNVQTSVNQKRLLHNRGTETEAYTIRAVLSFLQGDSLHYSFGMGNYSRTCPKPKKLLSK